MDAFQKKTKPKKLALQKKYLLENFPGARRLVQIVEVSHIVNNTAEEIIEASRLFSEAGINKIFLVSCASQIARTMMTQLVAKEAGKIPNGQQWLFVADDMFYGDTNATDVVIVEPPHRTDDPMFHAPLQPHALLKRFFKLPWQKRAEFLPSLDTLLKTSGV
jgi:hypothetical protein